MTQQYSVSTRDLDFLISNVEEPTLHERLRQAKENGPILAKGKYPTSKIPLALEEVDAELLIESLSSLLSEIGLNPDSEPNSIGLQIENLIDNFSND